MMTGPFYCLTDGIVIAYRKSIYLRIVIEEPCLELEMKITRRQLRQMINEALNVDDHNMLKEAFESYLTVYKGLASRASGDQEAMSRLWDQVTRQIKELINEESFRAKGRMHLGATVDREPRVFRE